MAYYWSESCGTLQTGFHRVATFTEGKQEINLQAEWDKAMDNKVRTYESLNEIRTVTYNPRTGETWYREVKKG